MDDAEENVFEKLGVLTLEELITVNGELKLPDIAEGKKVKSHVLKVILKFLSSEAVEQASDVGQSYFLRNKKFIDGKGELDKDTKKGIGGKTGSLEDSREKKVLKRLLIFLQNH